jgi:hypothetical protein
VRYNEPIDVDWEPYDPYAEFFAPPRRLEPGYAPEKPKRKRRMVGAMARCRNRKGRFIKCGGKRGGGRKRKCKTKCPAGTRRVCKGGFRKKGGHRKGRVCRKYVCRKV